MAIAFVGAADLGNNGGTTTNLTTSYSCGNGNNRLLVVAIAGDQTTTPNDDITSVTYNSVAMTLAVKFTTNVAAGARYLYIYYLVNPSAGANNVSISCTATHYLLAVAADYSGVKATGQPDATETNSTASGTTLTDTITTVADKSWAVLIHHDSADNVLPPTAGAGLTRRVFGVTFNFPSLFDSGGDITPAGNYNMTTDTAGTGGFIEHAAASFVPDTTVIVKNRDAPSPIGFQKNVNRGFASRTTRWSRGATDTWNKRRSGLFAPRGLPA